MRIAAQSGSIPNLQALLAVLCVLLSAFAAGLPATAQGAPSTDPGQVKAHVREILSQPEFQPESPDSPMANLGREIRSSWERTSRWLQDRWSTFRRWLGRIFSGFGFPAAGAAAGVISQVFAALFLGLAGWLIAWLIRNFWIQRSQRSAKTRTAFDEADEDEQIVLEPNAWLQQGDAYAATGDYRRAFRAAFVAVLLLLDQGGLIEFDRSRTNGDYLRLLRRKNVQRIYDLLGPLVVEFDRRWYGRAETGEEDYLRIQQAFERIRTLMTDPAISPAPAVSAGKA